ncbi:MAG: thiolase family protein [Candidatus Nanopelagicales bacterium]
MAWITGVGLTPFGKLPGTDALGLQERAANLAMDDADISAAEIDAVLVGYATTMNHIMPANLLAESLGIRPDLATGVNVGGATGLAMLALAKTLVDSGSARNVLCVGGEDRASGQSSVAARATLAQVGHRNYEVPLGGNIPAFYALLASAYLTRYGLAPEALAPLPVQMRAHAVATEGAQFRTPITVEDVRSARLIADPLTLLECCPTSDGGAAFVVSRDPRRTGVRLAGSGRANLHQHITEADLDDVGARRSSTLALDEAGIGVEDIDVAGVYDSFSVTLAVLLEDLGLAPAGGAGARAAAGDFAADGRLPLNTHGGLMSYGHCGVGGGMAHVVEVTRHLRGDIPPMNGRGAPRWGIVHADGGVLSAHVTMVLEAGA